MVILMLVCTYDFICDMYICIYDYLESYNTVQFLIDINSGPAFKINKYICKSIFKVGC